MSVFLVIIGLLGLVGLLWYSNERVNYNESWVYQACAAGWAFGCLVFAAKVYFE